MITWDKSDEYCSSISKVCGGGGADECVQSDEMCDRAASLTDAVVPQVARQALALVLRVVLPLPQLELLTGQILVLRLPLDGDKEGQTSEPKRPASQG